MYWPNGVPRVYAVNGPDIARVSADGHAENSSSPVATPPNSTDTGGEDIEASEPLNRQEKEPNVESSPESDTPKWEDEAINGICVSRSGHMFATITESSISLWQTRV